MRIQTILDYQNAIRILEAATIGSAVGILHVTCRSDMRPTLSPRFLAHDENSRTAPIVLAEQ